MEAARQLLSNTFQKDQIFVEFSFCADFDGWDWDLQLINYVSATKGSCKFVYESLPSSAEYGLSLVGEELDDEIEEMIGEETFEGGICNVGEVSTAASFENMNSSYTCFGYSAISCSAWLLKDWFAHHAAILPSVCEMLGVLLYTKNISTLRVIAPAITP